jgi:glutamate/aspartate transport system permease protein
VNLDFSVIFANWRLLIEGMQLSLLLTALGIAGGILIGAVLAVLRLSRFAPLALFAAGYVNLFRSIPLVLVLFWFYFLVPLVIGRPVGPFYAAVVAFILFEAAYYCEIIRSGIQGIPRGQRQAAIASGMTNAQAMRYVILPQAFRNMTPVLLTQAIILFQDTSLVYVVTLEDFMTSAAIIANRDLRIVEVYIFAAFVYFAMCFSASRLVGWLRARLEVTR